MIDFNDISYLKNGNSRQRTAYELLTGNLVMENLKPFDPILVGTIPIEIDIETSDLDIVCSWQSADIFKDVVLGHFSAYPNFTIRDTIINHEQTTIANFFIDHFQIEIFGQNVPSRQQSGYRHMVVEHALLIKYGDDFRTNIIKLKREGLKTEPAFANILNIQGDPYQALLTLENVLTL